jgi:16S rRNA (cytidine1402-2'-O)-methyltransferase
VGRLYIVGTPIGNLEDVTYRAVRVLGEVPLILAEDTRHSRKLLSRYRIGGRLMSYHQHNKNSRLDTTLAALEHGDVALISSAGMPSISDPGFELIAAAVQRGIEVDVLPGPSAVVTAVVGAALPAPGFVFHGFLPRQRTHKRARLKMLAGLPLVTVLYESPHRLVDTLEEIRAVMGERSLVLARELTKLHQEYVRCTVSDAIEKYCRQEPQGEFTIVIAPGEPPSPEHNLDTARNEVIRRRLEGENRRAVLKQVSEQFGIPRNDAYAMWIEAEDDQQQSDEQDSPVRE